MTGLATKHCAPCEGGTEPLSRPQAEAYLTAVAGWKLADGEPPKIAQSLKFKDFGQAMEFVNRVARTAEAEGTTRTSACRGTG